MKFRFSKALLLTAGLLGVTISCEEDPTTIGVGVIGENPLETGSETFDVFAYNRGVTSVETNKLPLYQLGTFNDPVYGRTEARITSQIGLSGGIGNPTFGRYSQLVEDESSADDDEATIPENEQVTGVFLNLPFLQNPAGDRDGDGVSDEFDIDPIDPNSDTDGDGVTDNQERLNGTDPLNQDTDGDGILDDEDTETVQNTFPRQFDLDSIYGNRDASFNLRVERSTFFLRDLDPDSGFLEAQEYFSSQQFSPGFVDEVLFDGEVTISAIETVVFNEDDPETEEIDESLQVGERIPPGIRVPLNIDFFQQNVIDKEGDSELLSRSNFNTFIRGIHLAITPLTEDILILFDLTQASISVEYEFDEIEEGVLVRSKDDYDFTLLSGGGVQPIQGNAVNTFNNDAYPPEIDGALDTGQNASRIYLKGGSGTLAEIELFEPNNGETIINQIKSNNWIINEANLVFFVDQEALEAVGGTEEPPRLYLYNAENNAVLYDINLITASTLQGRIDANFGGSLEESDGKGVQYKFLLTDYINDIIVRDSTNATLGLAVTSDITDTSASNAMLNTGSEGDVPQASTISPLGTILIGSDVPETDDRRLRLEIIFTATD